MDKSDANNLSPASKDAFVFNVAVAAAPVPPPPENEIVGAEVYPVPLSVTSIAITYHH